MTFSFLSLLLSVPAQAVPLQLNQQGRLLDDNGEGLSGSNQMIFKIYDSEEEGDILWSDTLTSEFRNGYYSVLLGTDDENNPLDSTVLEQYPLYLELTLNGEVLSPRHALSSVPYAQIAGVAESVDGGAVNASEVNINGVPVIDGNGDWVGTAPDVDFMGLSNRPPGLDDGDDDTQLDQQGVVNYVNGSQVNLGAASQVDGSDIVTADSFAGYLPADVADGDADTLAGISCATGEILSWDGSSSWVCTSDATLEWADIENMLVNNAVDLNAGTTIDGNAILTSVDDSDTLMGLSCGDGEVAKYDATLMEWYCDIDIDTDTVLSDTEVLGFVNGQALSLASGTQVDGSDVVTVDTFAANLPADLVDGDDNTQLGQSEVVSYVEAGSVNLAQNSQVNSRNIVGQPSVCANGQVLVYNSTSNDWECGDDTDTTLTPTEMQTMIEALSLNLQNVPQVNGENVLVESSTLNPANLDASTAVDGQVLTVSSGVASWETLAAQGSQCTETVQQHVNGDNYIDVDCGTHFYTRDVNNNIINMWYDGTCSRSLIEYGINNVSQYVDCGASSKIITGAHISSKLATRMARYGNSVCIINENSQLDCWGTTMIETNIPSGSFQSVKISQDHACAQSTTGEIECWGEDNNFQVSHTPSGVFVDYIVGYQYNCGINSSNGVQCWGNSYYTSGLPSGSFSKIVAGVNSFTTCALRTTGEIECWGGDSYNQVSGIPSGSFSKIVAGGNGHNFCALDMQGQVSCWGKPNRFINWLDNPPSLSFTEISLATVPCGLDTTGQIHCDSLNYTPPNGSFEHIVWGRCGINTQGQISCGEGSSSFSSTVVFTYTDDYDQCGVLSSGNIFCSDLSLP